MQKVILILIVIISAICFCVPINAQLFKRDFDKLPKYKKEFFDEHVDMAWYVYVHYDVPVSVTLAVIAVETNYGRKKRMMRRGDLFGTGNAYKYTQAWDEFGRNMKRNYFRLDCDIIQRKKIIVIKNKVSMMQDSNGFLVTGLSGKIRIITYPYKILI
jgi:hypothetical protein